MNRELFRRFLRGLWIVLFLAGCQTAQPAGMTVTFDGDQCLYDGPKSIAAGKIDLTWVVKTKTYDGFALVLATLKDGKTIDDLKAWPSTDPPPWLTIVNLWESPPDHIQKLTIQASTGPLFFVCFYKPPETKFGTLGPVEVKNSAAKQGPLPTITAHAEPTAAANPIPLVMDTDMGPDDWMAILYLLQRTDLSVKAITVAGTGLSHCGPGVQNILRLVKLSGREPLPAACGRETPLAGSHAFPDDWRTGADNLMNTSQSLPEGQNPLPGKTAVDLLGEVLLASPAKVTVLATGPLTNIAELIQGNPAAVKKIERIVIMGGAVGVPGNVGASVPVKNQSAEWNIYVDPQAAEIVFESGIPITLVPLDATNQVKITDAFYRKLQAGHLTPEAAWIYDLFNIEQGYFEANDYFWDQLTAVILSDDSLATYEENNLCVVQEEGANSGQTKVESGCPPIRTAVKVDAARFEEIFLDTLNNP